MQINSDNDDRLQSIVVVVLVFLLVLLVIGVTYAAFNYSRVGEVVNKISTATMTMNYTEGDHGITITNAMPITEEVGKTLSGENETFDFTIDISMTGNQALIYEITAVKQESSTLENDDVRLYLQSGTTPNSYTKEVLQPTKYTPLDNDDKYGAKKGEMVLATIGETSTKTTYYRLRMWVDKSYILSGVSKSFTIKVNAYGKDATVKDVNNLQ